MHNAPLPPFLVQFVTVVLPWCEGIVGLLMILGLWTSVALIAGSLLMLALQIGICLAQNWDVAGAQLIYVLLYFILLTYSERNRWSVDRWREAYRR
jgi:thiosulfate dehydrogenase [quinone] large subunit